MPSIKTKSTFAFSGLLLLCSLVFLILGTDRNANIYDEGVIVYGAERVLDGDVPYNDFWNVYGPAQFWVIAALFKLFGPSLLVERSWDILVRASIAVLTYLIVDRLTTKTLAITAWLMSLAWLWVVGFYGYPLLPATLFTMLSAYFFIGSLAEPKNSWMLLIAGISIGVAATFRHDVGFYTFFVEGISLVAFQFMVQRKATLGTIPKLHEFRRSVLLLCSGVALVGVPVTLYLLSEVPVSDLWHQLIVFPATVYPAMRDLPYPSLIGSLYAALELLRRGTLGDAVWHLSRIVPFYFHFVVLAAAIIFLVQARRNARLKESYADRGKVIVFLFLLILTLFLTSLVRPDQAHLIQVLVLSFVLATVLLKAFEENGNRKAVALILLALTGMGEPLLRAAFKVEKTLTAMTTPFFDNAPIANYASRNGAVARQAGGPIRATYFNIPDDQAKAIEYIQEHVPAKDKIFVGNGRHDVAFVSDVLFYFLSERHSGTKFHELHPGLTTTSDIQMKIIDQLISNKVDYVILWNGADNIREPNKSAESTRVMLLDKFLSEEYQEETRFGKYSIRKRKTSQNRHETLHYGKGGGR